MNRKKFFDIVRQRFAPGGLNQTQVDGYNAILDHWFSGSYIKRDPEGESTLFIEGRADEPIERLAYILATAYLETGGKIEPVPEIGRGKGKRYGVRNPKTGQTYYGRGLVQTTWIDNYEKLYRFTGIDVVNDPDRLLELRLSVVALVEGMSRGMYGPPLSKYINEKKVDYYNARRTVNVLNKASLIAGYAESFEDALRAAAEDRSSAQAPT